MKLVAIIQARMSSTRLPKKILLELLDEPMLLHVVQRVKRCALLDSVIVATGDTTNDDPISDFCLANNIKCFRGDSDDVLKRYVDAATSVQADVIVRISADCPLIDSEVIRQVIQVFQSEEYDYVSNEITRTYPHGLDVEVFTRAVLDKVDHEAKLPDEREHVTRYICTHPEEFRIGSVMHSEDLSGFRFVVDHNEDAILVHKIYEHFQSNDFSWQDAVLLMNENPEWKEINRKIAENHIYT